MKEILKKTWEIPQINVSVGLNEENEKKAISTHRKEMKSTQ